MSNQTPQNPNDPNPFSSPSPMDHKAPIQHESAGDATGGLIPYKNVPALSAYYLGLASLFPCIGLLFAIPAVVLGIMGLKKRKQNPEVKGSIHAWIGIVLGSIFTLIWGASIIMFIVGAVMA